MTIKPKMKKILTTICLVFTLFMVGRAQTGFVVSGNGGSSVGQIFAILAVNADGISSGCWSRMGNFFLLRNVRRRRPSP